jgi:hypothetical protein
MATTVTSTNRLTVIPQPAFDKRIQHSLTAPFNSGGPQLQRGFIQWDSTVMKDLYAGGTPPALKFLFNPSTISASYQITDATAQAALIFPTSANPAELRVPLQQQVGFTIMFDRTYELNWQGLNSPAPSQLVQNQGCNVDVMMLQQLTGQFNTVYRGNNPYYSINPNNGNVNGSGYNNATYTAGANANGTGINQGVMQLTFCYVYFGEPGVGLNYYGYIDSWDVQFTHFTHAMIPMRCVCDISFTLLPPPQAAPPNANSAVIAASQAGGIFPTPTGGNPGPIGTQPGLGV